MLRMRPEIPDIEILEVLCDSEKTSLYLARDEQARDLLVKALNAEYPAESERRGFCGAVSVRQMVWWGPKSRPFVSALRRWVGCWQPEPRRGNLVLF